ncbi:hypothetical protein [Pedobacter sp. GR22-10]|uniref:hypothetical protein n=1 Tax=Pedobacter sp. GR22-10 TaxID=2994472 RepID=UPI00224858C0|nr:hypothetical protein [Pedobacter sp. GR22-10]MCX2429853.1 hypothetical protein [Pedobacter sp. GR22-10]
MKLESIKTAKFKPLTKKEMSFIAGGTPTDGGTKQNGLPVGQYGPDGKILYYEVPLRVWTSDETSNGITCYIGERFTSVGMPTPPGNPYS